MGVPYFGHGTLEWIYKEGPGLVVSQYALPWEHRDHQPHVQGSATFSEPGKDELTISYEVVHIPAHEAASITMQSPDGNFTAIITTAGAQPLPFYFALVQGYPVTVSPDEQKYTYALSAIHIPALPDAATADPSDSHYSWERDLPSEVEVQIAVPAGELQRWLGWQATPPTPPWEPVPTTEMDNLRRLGIFDVIPPDSGGGNPYPSVVTAPEDGAKVAA